MLCAALPQIFYATFGNTTSGSLVLVAVDLVAGTLAPVDPSARASLGTDSPYCFDESLGLLVAAGGTEGGLVGWSPSTGQATVLRSGGLGGIVGVRSFGCDGRGVFAAGVVYWEEEGSPTRLLAFDFSEEAGDNSAGSPFHNSTAPQDFHDLVITPTAKLREQSRH